MKKFFLSLMLILPLFCFSEEDWSWWNDIHGWKPGMKGWRMWLTISPGGLGPNALPVPEVKKGLISSEKELEFGTDFHFKTGDNTQNIYGRYYRPFANNKIAVEFYGVMLERYAMSEKVRDERIARDKDGRGLAIGDLYFATMFQLIKDRKLPDTMLRMACKTASGGRLDAARYADSPGYFFDLSFSKQLNSAKQTTRLLPYGSIGFYSWQTNDEGNLQNDALMYGLGLEVGHNNWSVSNSWSGYHGYKDNGDRPMVYTFDLQKKLKNNTFRIQYLHGLHDWMYNTVKFSFIWRWN